MSAGMILIGFVFRGQFDSTVDEIVKQESVLVTLSCVLAAISSLLLIGWLSMVILGKRKISTILKISGITLVLVATAIRIVVTFAS